MEQEPSTVRAPASGAAAATLAAALFNPERFADHLRDEVELGDLSRDLVDVVARTLQPAAVTIWVRGRA